MVYLVQRTFFVSVLAEDAIKAALNDYKVKQDKRANGVNLSAGSESTRVTEENVKKMSE